MPVPFFRARSPRRAAPPHLSSVLLFERTIRERAISQAFHNETGRQRQAMPGGKNFTILNAFLLDHSLS